MSRSSFHKYVIFAFEQIIVYRRGCASSFKLFTLNIPIVCPIRHGIKYEVIKIIMEELFLFQLNPHSSKPV